MYHSDKSMAFHHFTNICVKQKHVSKLLQEIRRDLDAPVNSQYEDRLVSRDHDLANMFEQRQKPCAHIDQASGGQYSPPPRYTKHEDGVTDLLKNMTVLQMHVCVQANEVFNSLNHLEFGEVEKADEVKSSSLCSVDSQTPLEIVDFPYSNTPSCILKLLGVSNEKWEQKIEGLQQVEHLTEFHPDVIIGNLHDFCIAVLEEVKNLRSAVARVAIGTLGHMFEHLQGSMNKELTFTTPALMHKSMESIHFIHDEVCEALSKMVQNCGATAVMNALIIEGLSHQSKVVRQCTARSLKELAEKLGPQRFTRAPKHYTHRFLDALSRLAVDAASEVRCHARAALVFLSANENFLQLVESSVDAKLKEDIKSILIRAR